MTELSRFVAWRLADAVCHTTGVTDPSDGDELFWEFVLSERIVLCGRCNGEGPQVVIPKGVCATLDFRDYQKSTLQSADAKENYFDTVLAYPVVHAPDRVERLDGLTLKQAYDYYVRGDPEVWRLIQCQLQDDGPDANRWRDARYYPLQFNFLPLNLYCSGDRFFTDPENIALDIHGQASRLTHAALARRATALADLLESGELDVWAFSAATGVKETVLQAIWRDQAFSFDADKNHILGTNNNMDGPIDLVRWTAVMLKRPQAKVVETDEPDAECLPGRWHDAEPLTKGQRAVFEAIARLCPNGPTMLPIKDRNAAIISDLKKHGFTSGTSASTINRTFAKVDYRRS